jgi:hypothetical protein
MARKFQRQTELKYKIYTPPNTLKVTHLGTNGSQGK